MDLVWNSAGVWPLFVTVLTWAMALLVFLARPERAQNRWLALIVLLEPFFFVWGSAAIVFVASARDAHAFALVSLFVNPVLLPVQLLFLSTLDTPLVRPLRTLVARVLMVLFVPVVWLLYLSARGSVVSVTPSAVSTWTVQFGPLFNLIQIPILLMMLYTVVATISAWQTAALGTATRRRARFFALAFGLKYLIVMTLIVSVIFFAPGGTPTVGGESVVWFLMPTNTFVAILLMSYGLLKHQLFGFELKVKWALKRGTVVGTLAAVFFVVKETVEFFLPIEGLVANVGGAVGVALVAYPAWKGASHLIERILPGVENTHEYRIQRGEAVYQAALEELLADGVMSVKERKALQRLQDELGIETGRADDLKNHVMYRMARESHANQPLPRSGSAGR